MRTNNFQIILTSFIFISYIIHSTVQLNLRHKKNVKSCIQLLEFGTHFGRLFYFELTLSVSTYRII